VLRLARGRGNSLTRAGLGQLAEFFEERAKDPRAVLIRHEGRSFCTGLDLHEVSRLDRPAMSEFMGTFHRALRACFGYPGAVVAQMHGHALAGGALLALACDARVLASGSAKIGIHGVQMGIAYPQVAVEIARQQLPRPEVERALYSGQLLNDREALVRGWVDALVAPVDLESAAQERLDALSSGDRLAFARNKRSVRATALDRLRDVDAEGSERWLDQWFSTETQRRVRLVLEASRSDRSESSS
jgi:Delta3-Delta2-enoyl-CoA isomerase